MTDDFDDKILEALRAFEDFQLHSKVEDISHQISNEYKILNKEVEYLAAKYETTCDYIIQEFILN